MPKEMKGQPYYRTSETSTLTGISRTSHIHWLKPEIFTCTLKDRKRHLISALVFMSILSLVLSGCSILTPDKGPGSASGTPTSATSAPSRGITGTITTGPAITSVTVPVAPNGGTVRIVEAGHPLNGLEVTIPAGSYPDTRQVKISSAPIQSQTFGKKLNAITPLITVDAGGGYSKEPMEVRIPVQAGAGRFAMAFSYNHDAKSLEGLPVLSQDSGSITIATKHFFSFLVSDIDELLLQANIDSDFKPGVDDWQFVNDGSYIAPGGHCAGQSVSALWYYAEQPDGAGIKLFGRYDNNGNKPGTPGFDSDDSLGYRFANMVHSDINWSSEDNRFWSRQRGVDDELSWKRFAYAIALTGQPQLVSIARGEIGHAMIVYRVDKGTLYVADPNYPGNTTRRIEFSNGKFAPYNSGLNAAAIARGDNVSFDKIGYRAKTAVVDWTKIRQRWAEVKSKSIGNDKFPAYSLWYGDKEVPREFKDINETTRPYVGIGGKSTKADIKLTVYREGKEVKADKDGLYPLKTGSNQFGVRVDGKTDKDYRYIDFKYVNIIYNSPASPTSAGKTVYKLQGNPTINQVTTPSASGVSATIHAGSATYTSPDPKLIKVMQTVGWEMPVTIDPAQSSAITFGSSVSVAEAKQYTQHIPRTGVESWQQARDVELYPSVTANPMFRIVTTFSAGTTSGIVQYSPDDGKSWQSAFSAQDAWSRYFEPGMKQVLQPIGLWSKHLQQYSPPSAAKTLPLMTLVSKSSLQFRLRPDLAGTANQLPDNLYITIRAEATGLTGGNGASLGTVVFTYQKQ